MPDKTTTYVYSMTTLGSVGAWSWYEYPWLVEAHAMLGNDVYLRSGDSVFIVDPERLEDQDETGADVEVVGEIQSHYLDFGSPGAPHSSTVFHIVMPIMGLIENQRR